MSEWVTLCPADKDGCAVRVRSRKQHVDARFLCDGEEEGSIIFTQEEAIAFACLLPEIKALLAVVREYSDYIGPLEEQNPNDGGGGYEAATKIRDALKPFEERKDE